MNTLNEKQHNYLFTTCLLCSQRAHVLSRSGERRDKRDIWKRRFSRCVAAFNTLRF